MARIVLITPYFEPSLAFQEWVLAKCLTRAGHMVTVVAAAGEAHAEKNTSVLRAHPDISVHRVKCVGAGQTIFPLSAARLRDLCAGHDAAVVNAPNHGFGYRALRVLPRTLPAAVCFGDLLDNRMVMNPLLRRWKDRWYRWLFERADRLTYNTRECLAILREVGLGRHEGRAELAGLPYDEEFFYLEEKYASPRPPDRARILTTITRTLAHKPFDQWLPPVFAFLRANASWRYCFAGMGDDSSAQQIRRLVVESGLADRIDLLPMQDQASIRRLYSEADLGLFPRATIGIQQAMATGLPVILPQRLTVAHLVQEGRNGYYYDSLESAAAVLSKAAAHQWPERRELAADSSRWSGARYAEHILKGLV
jgi:glycosyltransferase involved in cell wall biosynthesis